MSIPRILTVDDDKGILQSYREILTPEDKLDLLKEMASSLFGDDENDESDGLDSLLDDSDLLGGDDSSIEVEEGLSANRYDLVQASQGQEAIDYVKEACEQNKPFSLVFLDMRMPPGIDGLETAKAIRQLDPHVEIVIMTAYSDYSYEQIVEEVGNPERLLYFHKPFQTEKIQQLATNLTQKWLLERSTRG